MGKKTEFLYLSEPDLIKAGVLDTASCIEVIEEVYGLLNKGDYIMGGSSRNDHGHQLYFPKKSEFSNMPLAGPDRRFMAMVAYLGGRFNICGEKWYGSNTANAARGLPRSVLMTILNDPDTCEPISLMSANLISATRTGCVPGVGSRYLAPENAEVCTIIGAGPINKACFKAISYTVKSLKEIVVYDIYEEKAKEFAKWSKEELGISGHVVQSLEKAVREGDIISCAASRVKVVQMKNEWIKKGSLLILTGPAQVDDDYWLSTNIVFDNTKMHEVYMQEAHKSSDRDTVYDGMIAGQVYRLIDAGKLPLINDNLNLGQIIANEKTARKNKDDRVTFITGGMAVYDVGWSYELYQKALKMGLGQKLLLWDEPHWM